MYEFPMNLKITLKHFLLHRFGQSSVAIACIISILFPGTHWRTQNICWIVGHDFTANYSFTHILTNHSLIWITSRCSSNLWAHVGVNKNSYQLLLGGGSGESDYRLLSEYHYRPSPAFECDKLLPSLSIFRLPYSIWWWIKPQYFGKLMIVRDNCVWSPLT